VWPSAKIVSKLAITETSLKYSVTIWKVAVMLASFNESTTPLVLGPGPSSKVRAIWPCV
jgi:hypothetical protein